MWRYRTVIVLFFVLWPRIALAGMPSISFSDVARLRLQTISFFVMGLVLSAAVIMAIWNGLSRDFAWLPRLSYAKACGLVVLWGLLFVIVLTMISGARELMTPGAWEKNGLTYKLRRDEEPDVRRPNLTAVRREKLMALGRALRQYAEQHDGSYPPSIESADEIPVSTWELYDLPGTRYIYVPGSNLHGGQTIIAYEPDVYSSYPQLLFADGTPSVMGIDEIRRHLGHNQ